MDICVVCMFILLYIKVVDTVSSNKYIYYKFDKLRYRYKDNIFCIVVICQTYSVMIILYVLQSDALIIGPLRLPMAENTAMEIHNVYRDSGNVNKIDYL